MAKIQSVEPNIADLANGWLKSYKLPYKLEQESLNAEIDQALNDYASKNGGAGGNRPDAKLLMRDKNLKDYPVLIEYKGYKDKLVRLDADGKVANKTAKNLPDFKTINTYAVNGAVHYANAILHYTSYTDIIAIGMTGYKNDAGELQYEIGVYYVSKSNFGVGQKVDDYTDFSFLRRACGHFLGLTSIIKPLEFAGFYINDQGRINPFSVNLDVISSIYITLRYSFVDINFQLIIVIKCVKIIKEFSNFQNGFLQPYKFIVYHLCYEAKSLTILHRTLTTKGELDSLF